MRVRVLGCSGAIARDCKTTSFLIDQDTLIDAGTGVGDLTREEMLRVQDVFLTHSHLDHVACLPLMVDTIAAARNIDRVALIKKALKKARAYRLLTAHVAGQRQAIEAAINAAANLDALETVHIAYTLPAAPVIDTPAVQPNDERAQNSAAIEAESGSTAIESGSGSAVIGD